jgi:hypothetical protein
MTQKLQELFNLPNLHENGASETNVSMEENMAMIKENKDMIAEADAIIDKIDTALPHVNDLDITDDELDELSKLAKDKFEDLMDLGMNVEARYSGAILQTAGTLLGHAITAKQAKIDRKLKTIDLQLKKARLDMSTQKADGDKLSQAVDGNGIVIDRNELLKQILGKG